MIPVCEAVAGPSTLSAPCGNDRPAAEASGSRVLSASSSSLPANNVSDQWTATVQDQWTATVRVQ